MKKRLKLILFILRQSNLEQYSHNILYKMELYKKDT